MPAFDLTLPTGETIRVCYATLSDGWAGNYFNGKRLGFNGELTKHNYNRVIPELRTQLVHEIQQAGITFDAVVCPPSMGEDIEPYRQAVLERWPVRDLTGNFTRQGLKRAVHPDTSVEDMIAEFGYTPDGKEAELRSLLVVDESVASGKTIGAVLYHLREHGMRKDAAVAAASCVRMLGDTD